MATAFPIFNSTIRATASAKTRRSEPERSPKASSGNWWAPLFGMSSEADYMSASPQMEIETERSRSVRAFTVGCFTEEKAKELRKKTLESSTFHDTMYHSAIASRLASDRRSI